MCLWNDEQQSTNNNQSVDAQRTAKVTTTNTPIWNEEEKEKQKMKWYWSDTHNRSGWKFEIKKKTDLIVSMSIVRMCCVKRLLKSK